MNLRGQVDAERLGNLENRIERRVPIRAERRVKRLTAKPGGTGQFAHAARPRNNAQGICNVASVAAGQSIRQKLRLALKVIKIFCRVKFLQLRHLRLLALCSGDLFYGSIFVIFRASSLALLMSRSCESLSPPHSKIIRTSPCRVKYSRYPG